MLNRELIQRVQSLYSKGVESDDSRLSNRLIYNKLITVRSRLIRQRLDKKKRLSDWSYQTISCVEIKSVPVTECVVTGCKVYRTVEKIPKFISTSFGDGIRSVTSLDGSTIFSGTSWDKLKYDSYSKYSKNSNKYWIKNGYMYFTFNQDLLYVTIEAILEDIVDILSLDSCAEKCITNLDIDFPIDSDMIEVLIGETVKELVILFSQVKEDKVNDTNEEV